MTDRIGVTRRGELTAEETPALLQAAAAGDQNAVAELLGALEPIAWQRTRASARKIPDLWDDLYACGLLAISEALAEESVTDLGRLVGSFNIHYRRLSSHLIANHRTKGAANGRDVFRSDRQSKRTKAAAKRVLHQTQGDAVDYEEAIGMFGEADTENSLMEDALQRALSAGVLSADEFRAVRIWAGMETGRKTSEKVGGPRMGISEWDFRQLKESALDTLGDWVRYFYAESLENTITA